MLQSFEGAAAPSSFAFEHYNLIVSGYRSGAHDLAEPPLFVDPATLDFHLAAGSPGIDAALADAAPSADIDGPGRSDDLA